jgi:hypothetical protein
LKPYHGGNDRLWLLHQLDIKRKHHRLLEIILYATGFSVPTGFPSYPAFTPEFGGWVVSRNDKTLLGSFRKGTPHNWFTADLKITQSVAINEPPLIEPVRVIETLHDLAGLAQSIIKLFDF